MKFKKEILKDLISEYKGHGFDGYIVRVNDIIDTTRWENHYELVFEYKGKCYISHYSLGATEDQDTVPYEYDDDDIICNEVEPYEEVVIKYRSIT